MNTRTIKAWIEPTANGRFSVIEEGILFPGYQNRVCRTWADRRGARDYCRRNGRDFQKGACPLLPVTEARRQQYRDETAALRAKAATRAQVAA